MSRTRSDRAAGPYAAETLDRATSSRWVRLRSGLALGGLVVGFAILAAVAVIVAVVVVLALATTATS